VGIDNTLSFVKLLLEKGAKSESKDKDGWAAPSWAALGEREAVVKLLTPMASNQGSRAAILVGLGVGHLFCTLDVKDAYLAWRCARLCR
jgi:ankyrin repeat protein